MQYSLTFVILFISILTLGQKEEIRIKSNLRIVIYEGDQYKKWFGQYHQEDLSQLDEDTPSVTSLKGYEKKSLKKKVKARKKEIKAKIYHEATIPIELIFTYNSDSLPVPVIIDLLADEYQDSLIHAKFTDLTVDNSNPEFGNGYCSFSFYLGLTNNHFSNNDEKLSVYEKQMGFRGYLNFKDSNKSGINATYNGNIYKRNEYSIYKINGKTFSYIPFFYRHQVDLENKLNELKYK